MFYPITDLGLPQLSSSEFSQDPSVVLVDCSALRGSQRNLPGPGHQELREEPGSWTPTWTKGLQKPPLIASVPRDLWSTPAPQVIKERVPTPEQKLLIWIPSCLQEAVLFQPKQSKEQKPSRLHQACSPAKGAWTSGEKECGLKMYMKQAWFQKGVISLR